MLPWNTNNVDAQQALAILNDVSLVEFRAEPSDLSPFGTATLMWTTDGPSGFRVRINGMRLANTGELRVRPTSNETYRLYAYVGTFRKLLGSVSVKVNVARCIIRDSEFIDEFLQFALQREIDASDELYFRWVAEPTPFGTPNYILSTPEVLIKPDRISFRLRLGRRINNFPDASVDIDASFGLSVIDDEIIVGRRRLVAIDETIHADVTMPFTAWLLAGPVILPIILGNATDDARRSTRASIGRLVVEVIAPVFDQQEGPPNLVKQRVRIYTGPGSSGVVEVRYCPGGLPSLDDGR